MSDSRRTRNSDDPNIASTDSYGRASSASGEQNNLVFDEEGALPDEKQANHPDSPVIYGVVHPYDVRLRPLTRRGSAPTAMSDEGANSPANNREDVSGTDLPTTISGGRGDSNPSSPASTISTEEEDTSQRKKPTRSRGWTK